MEQSESAPFRPSGHPHSRSGVHNSEIEKNGGKISRWYFSEERGVRVVLKVVLSIRKTCYGVGKAGFSQGFEGKLPAFGGVVSCGVAPYWCRVSGGL